MMCSALTLHRLVALAAFLAWVQDRRRGVALPSPTRLAANELAVRIGENLGGQCA